MQAANRLRSARSDSAAACSYITTITSRSSSAAATAAAASTGAVTATNLRSKRSRPTMSLFQFSESRLVGSTASRLSRHHNAYQHHYSSSSTQSAAGRRRPPPPPHKASGEFACQPTDNRLPSNWIKDDIKNRKNKGKEKKRKEIKEKKKKRPWWSCDSRSIYAESRASHGHRPAGFCSML